MSTVLNLTPPVRIRHRYRTLFAMLLAIGFENLQVEAQGVTKIIAATNNTAPDGNGKFSQFRTPVVNDSGQVGFRATLTNTSGGPIGQDGDGIFRGDGTTLVQVARGGQAVPGGNGTFGSFSFQFSRPAINDSGNIAFTADYSPGIRRGVFRGDGTPLVQLGRVTQAAPDGNGTFGGFEFSTSLNNVGQSAFLGYLTGTSGGQFSSDTEGIFRSDGTNIVQIARGLQLAPGGNGRFDSFSLSPAINESGQVAFAASLSGNAGGPAGVDAQGIFRGNGSTLIQIARGGQPAPGTNGVLFLSTVSFDPVFNDAGEAAFKAFIIGASDGTSNDQAIFRGNGTSTVRIARKAQLVPNGNGSFLDFQRPSALSLAGQAAFRATLTGTTGGTADNEAIFRGDGSTLVEIARKGQLSPDGNGTLSGLSGPAMNEAGQILFSASLSGTSGGASDNAGLFLYDDSLGLLKVARKGDAILGSTITSLSGGLNDAPGVGVAYNFTLANFREGIALWSLPAPGDINGDGAYDVADYVAWRKKGGTQNDYNTWRANFGRSLNGFGAAASQHNELAAVPEPGFVILSMAAASFIVARRRRCGCFIG
jgi:hypothetical protein